MDVLRILLIICLTTFSINAHAQSMEDEDEEIETPTQPVTPPGETAVLGFFDDELYEGDATVTVNLSGSVSNDNVAISNVRDINLSFNGKFYVSNNATPNPGSIAGLDIEVNGIRRITFNTLQPSSPNIHFKKHFFRLNRNWLQNGDNTISIIRSKSNPIGSGVFLETTDIRMEYNAPIQLAAEQKLTQLYGHFVGTKEHLTGLRAEFDSIDSDLSFSVTGFDIDSATEIAVFLNQQLIGYLKQGGNGAFNAGDTFELEQEDFVSSGVNTIEFIQTSSSSNEPWGVTNLELSTATSIPFLTGVLLLLLDD